MKVCPAVSLILLFAFFYAIEGRASLQADSPQTIVAEEPLVVTVSATPVPRAASSAPVVVLERSEIEQAHADTLGDLLVTVPFLHVSRPGHGGAMSTATIRGGDPNFTLVLVDGVPVNDPTTLLGGSYDFSMLAADNIERIEIVRGPMSSIYGSAASAGVIHVLTRRGREAREITVEGMIGNPWMTGRIRLGGGADIGSTSLSLSGSLLTREGVNGGVEDVDSVLGVVSLSARTDLDGERSLDWTFRYQQQESSVFPENGGGPEFAIDGTLKDALAREAVLGVAYGDPLTADWDLRLSWDLFDRFQDTDTPAVFDSLPPGPGTLPPILSETDFVRNRVRAGTSWTPDPRWSAYFGFGFEDERGTTDSTIAGSIPADFDLNRTNVAATGELDYRLDWVTLDFNIRVDRIEGFDVEASPGVGAVVPLADTGARVRAAWARAFKAPSFYAIGDPLIGNSQLSPERSRGFDIAIEDIPVPAPVPLDLSVTYFRNRFEDLIDFSPSLFQLVNRSAAVTRGVEAMAAIELTSGVTLTGHATYLDWSVEGTTEPLRDRPRWRGGAGLRMSTFTDATLSWDTIWVGRRYDFQIPVPAQDTVGGYSTTDVALTYGAGRLDLFARIENLFDSEYHEFVGFPDPGFGMRVGASTRIEY